MKLIEKQKMQQRQSLPLEQKIQMTKQRIKAWIEHWDGDVYLAFSGGKDSTVLKHIIESMGYSIPCVFSNTGLEMPEIVKFARRQENVVEIKPKMTYDKVWKKVGIPVGSKMTAKKIRVLSNPTEKNKKSTKLYDEGVTSEGFSAPSYKLANKWRKFVGSDIKISDQCCDHLKKEPLSTYEKREQRKGFSAMMAAEGGERGRLTSCNNFTGKRPTSHPMLFWLEGDIFAYIKKFNVEICEVYYNRGYVDGELVACDSPFIDLPTVAEIQQGTSLKMEVVPIAGEKRTGCMFCGFGAHLEKGLNRFQRMNVTHPRQHAIVMDRMGMREAMEMINVKVDYEDSEE